MKKWVSAAAVTCLLAISTAGQAQTAPKPQDPGRGGRTGGTPPAGGTQTKSGETAKQRADEAFMRQAAMSNMAEVELGRLAARQAASADVRQFGERMVDDHTKAGGELKSLASKQNVTLPAELDQKHQAMQDKLAKMKGEDFDRAYMQHMVSAHREAVKLFETEAKSGRDEDTRAWAKKTLPTLQQHLKMAEDLNRKGGKGGASPQ
jgi:putative membrane protein